MNLKRNTKDKETVLFSLLRETKKRFYENLDPNLITDNRKFWKQVKSFLYDKIPFNNNITLFEGNELVRENTACAEILNNFFRDSVKNLDINRDLYTNNDTNLDDPIENIIERFKKHPSVLESGKKDTRPTTFHSILFLKVMSTRRRRGRQDKVLLRSMFLTMQTSHSNPGEVWR